MAVFTLIGILTFSSCTSQQSAHIRLSDLPECVVVTSDRVSEHKQESSVRPKWDYVRSTLITQRIRILEAQPNGGLVVFSSALDGLRPGDVITHVYGIAAITFARYFDLLELNVNREATFTVQRDDTEHTISAFNNACRYYSSGRIERAFYNELYAGRPINLLVLPARVTVDGSGSDTSLESLFQRRFGDDPRAASALYGIEGFQKFRIIENRNLESVLKELELKQLGLLDESTAIRVGRMMGANFLAETTYQFIASGRTIERVITIKKVYNLEQGTVVGIDTITVGPTE